MRTRPTTQLSGLLLAALLAVLLALLPGCATATTEGPADGRRADVIPAGMGPADVSAAGTTGATGAAGATGTEPTAQPPAGDGGDDPMSNASETAATAEVAGPPVETAPGRFLLKLGLLALEIDAGRGARVLSFSHAGHNVLQPVARANGFLNGGSTLWTSPQADWSWPPLAAHDEAPYDVKIEGAALIATGGAADVAATRVSISKRFSAEPAGAAMRIEYTLHNAGDAPVALAPWEVSRHPVGGLTFWPGSEARGDFAPHPQSGHLWMPYDELFSGSDGKVFADGTGGWLAHAQDGLLVVRSWSDVPKARQAPGEAEIEVYLAATYIELECQGPHGEIPAAGASSWSVHWHVLPIPAGVDVEVGSEGLLELARSALP